jgi:hypothetical protein
MSDPYDIRYYPDRERIKELESDSAKLTVLADDLRHQLAAEREKNKWSWLLQPHPRLRIEWWTGSYWTYFGADDFPLAPDAAKEPA